MKEEFQKLDGNYDVSIPFITKHGKRYRLIEIPEPRVCTDRESEILNKVYGILWMDAYYDPDNEIIRKYAKPLADLMQELNSTLHFKL